MTDRDSISPDSTYFLPLESLISRLGREGFEINPQQLMEAAVLLDQLGGNTAASDLRYLLAPLFARDRIEQQRFYEIFDQYLTPGGTRDPRSAASLNRERFDRGQPAKSAEVSPGSGRSRLVPSLLRVVAGMLLLFMLYQLIRTTDVIRYLVVPIVILALGYLMWTRMLPVVRRWFKKEGSASDTENYFERTAPISFRLQPPLQRLQILEAPAARRVQHTFQRDAEFLIDYRIDIPETVRATVRRAGMVDIRYRPETYTSGYLFLLDMAQSNQHLLGWFDYLHHFLRDEYLQIERYYYEYDPRLCWGDDGIRHRLEDLYAGQRLVLIGSGHVLIDQLYGNLHNWARRILDLWEDKILLSLVPEPEWAANETLLNQEFLLAPASLYGLLDSIRFLNEGKEALARAWFTQNQRYRQYRMLDPMQAPSRDLRQRLNAETYLWLCVCAVYPELDWPLTIYLGRQLEERTGTIVNLKNITALSELPWFQEGRIPDIERRELIYDLPQETLLRVRGILLELLEKDVPPPASYAFEKHRMQVLRNQFPFTGDPERRRAILTELRQLVRISRTQDEELLQFVEDTDWEKPGRSEDLDDALWEAGSSNLISRIKRAVGKEYGLAGIPEDLRWVRYQDDRIFFVKDQLWENIRSAQRILLYIPGITDDLKGTMQALRPLIDRRDMDLLLIFDYESIATAIDDTARLLSERIQKLDLPGSDKELILLADNLGGLVARWFIERESGHLVTSRLVMVGTPNSGLKLGWAFNIIRVLGNLIPLSGWLFKPVSRIFKTSLQIIHNPKEEQHFLNQLNASSDPKVPYTVIAGNTQLGSASQPIGTNAISRLSARLFTGSQHNDEYSSVDSMKSVPNNAQLEVIEVPATIATYYQSDESRRQILDVLRKQRKK